MSKLKKDMRVVTNDAFAKATKWKTPWRGTLVSENALVAGNWHVRVDGLEKLQSIHEKFMEQEKKR